MTLATPRVPRLARATVKRPLKQATASGAGRGGGDLGSGGGAIGGGG